LKSPQNVHWAESLGKININKTRQALTPIALIGPVDQHSFLQLIIDGVRDKTVTFIKIADLKDNTIIPKSNDKNLGLEYAEGLSFNDLLNKQADATIESVEAQSDIPCDVITISTVDEWLASVNCMP
jgi:glucose-6-phosphate isomerase